MTRLEVTETELCLLQRLLDAKRDQDRALILKDGSLSFMLTETDSLMERINTAKLRHEPRRRRRA